MQSKRDIGVYECTSAGFQIQVYFDNRPKDCWGIFDAQSDGLFEQAELQQVMVKSVNHAFWDSYRACLWLCGIVGFIANIRYSH